MLSRREMRLVRARHYEILIGEKIPVATIARTFQFAESSVYADLELLTAEREKAKRAAETN